MPETHKHPVGTEKADLSLIYPGDSAVPPSFKQHTGLCTYCVPGAGLTAALEAEVSIFP